MRRPAQVLERRSAVPGGELSCALDLPKINAVWPRSDFGGGSILAVTRALLNRVSERAGMVGYRVWRGM